MKKILLVVDMQNGFNRYEQMHILSEKIKKLTNSNLFDIIIATKFFNQEGSQYTRILNWHHLIKEEETNIIDGINYDIVIDKKIYTCVNANFMKLIKAINDGKKPTHIFICGADTDCCVLKTATDLFEHKIMPIVLTEYCESNGGFDSQKAGLLVMTRLIGKKCLINSEVESKEDIDNILKSSQ